MRAEWRAVAKRAGFRVQRDGSTTVVLEGGSRQLVTIEEVAGRPLLHATSIIARPKTLTEAAGEESALRYAWDRNRLSDLVGFAVDHRGRLIGETWIPLERLDPGEFELYVRELARVCDWQEFRLSGVDEY